MARHWALFRDATLASLLLGSSAPAAPTPRACVGITEATWVRTAQTMYTPRASHTATLLKDGTVLIVGGWNGHSTFGEKGEAPEPPTLLATAEIYDPQRDRFRPLANRLAVPRVSHRAARLADGSVLIVGGVTQGGAPDSLIELYIPASQSFKVVARHAERFAGADVIALPRGGALVTGGSVIQGDTIPDIWYFDGRTLSPRGHLAIARSGHNSLLVGDSIWLIGGSAGEGTNPGIEYISVAPPFASRGTCQSGCANAESHFSVGVLATSPQPLVVVRYGWAAPGTARYYDGTWHYASWKDPATSRDDHIAVALPGLATILFLGGVTCPSPPQPHVCSYPWPRNHVVEAFSLADTSFHRSPDMLFSHGTGAAVALSDRRSALALGGYEISYVGDTPALRGALTDAQSVAEVYCPGPK